MYGLEKTVISIKPFPVLSSCLTVQYHHWNQNQFVLLQLVTNYNMVLVRVKKNFFFGPLRMPPTPPPPPPPLSISFSLSHCPVLFPSPSSLCFVMDHFLSSNKFPFLPPSNFKHQMKCHWCQYMGYNTITHTHTYLLHKHKHLGLHMHSASIVLKLWKVPFQQSLYN